LPLEREFGGLSITYGFTSFKLKNYIAKNSPKGTAPNLDQHASCELNSKGDEICARDGAACDLIIEKQSMANIVRFITSKLNYDRIYYYGQDRPLHVSANASPARHLQVMKDSPTGRRYPASKGFGTDAIKLAETL
jgi:hypothetical protein